MPRLPVKRQVYIIWPSKVALDSLLKMAFKGDYAKYREKVAIKWANRALAAGKPY